MILNMNLTVYMSSPDRLPEVRTYAEAVDAALMAGRINPPLTTRCQECDSDFADSDEAHEDTDHLIIATTSDTFAVVVGCEGYFQVNPNLVGIDSPMWQDWMHNASGGTLPQGAIEVTGVHDGACDGNHLDTEACSVTPWESRGDDVIFD